MESKSDDEFDFDFLNDNDENCHPNVACNRQNNRKASYSSA